MWCAYGEGEDNTQFINNVEFLGQKQAHNSKYWRKSVPLWEVGVQEIGLKVVVTYEKDKIYNHKYNSTSQICHFCTMWLKSSQWLSKSMPGIE